MVCRVLLLLALAMPAGLSAAQPDRLGPPWISAEEGGASRIRLYFFYSENCPHCRAARPVVMDIAAARPWLDVRAHSVLSDEGERLFEMLARMLDVEPEAVPTFFLCGEQMVGFGAATTGRQLADLADQCRARLVAAETPGDGDAQAASPETPPLQTPTPQTTAVTIPFIGRFEAQALSLPVLTVLLGSLDAFNPCAFFVLLFLLSLMVHARSRARMALVGGIFVAISGLMYFIFMAAWLNLFLVLANLAWITLAAGLVAVLMGLLGVKDFFAFHEGPSLSMSRARRDSLLARVRGLLSADNMAVLLGGTVALAVAANLYELICTSGFPLIFTRILTLHELSPQMRYAYLAAYNLVYVVPLFAIVAAFVWRLGAHKLSERQGRILKLISGLVMLLMGLMLVLAPDQLGNVLATAVILAGALLVAGLVVAIEHWRRTS